MSTWANAPRHLLDGLLTAIHIQRVMRRLFYTLDTDKDIDDMSSTCHKSASQRNVPYAIVEQSTYDLPDIVNDTFAGDIVKSYL